MSTKDNDTVSLTVIAAEPQITISKALRAEIKKIAQRALDHQDTNADHRRFRAIAKEIGCSVNALGSVLGMCGILSARRHGRGITHASSWPITVAPRQLRAAWGEPPLHVGVSRRERMARARARHLAAAEESTPKAAPPAVNACAAAPCIHATLALPGQKEPFVLVIKDVTSLDLLDRLVRSYL